VVAEAGHASIATFSPDELKVLIDTAHSYGVKVAAHATNQETIKTLLRLNIDSIEHEYSMYPDEALLRLFRPSTKCVHTLAAYRDYTMNNGQDGGPWEATKRAFNQAVAAGMDNIACGGDTGVFTHGDNMLEKAYGEARS
jgi:imidazolonepropionase-like amidohydrolase